jgi:hypothetical protein
VSLMTQHLMPEEADMLDPEALDIPLRLSREELYAASDLGWRRDGWRFDDMEEGG